MGEHKLPPNILKKKRWDNQRGVDLGHHRYVWRSSTQGTFKYHEQSKGLYGALKTRRQFKIARKLFKKLLNGPDRAQAMINAKGDVP